VQTDDKERARLNCLSHLLDVVPWKRVPMEKVKLPKRQDPKGYKAPDWTIAGSLRNIETAAVCVSGIVHVQAECGEESFASALCWLARCGDAATLHIVVSHAERWSPKKILSFTLPRCGELLIT